MFIAARPSLLKPLRSTATDDLHPTEARWFALRVGYRKEKVVAKLLRQQEINCFLPLRERPYHYKSKTGVRQIPLLGGYVFVKIIGREAAAVHAAPFVFGFVRIGRVRKQVTEQEIEVLRRISCDLSLSWAVEDAVLPLRRGCRVEIARGPLAGVRGHYVEARSKKAFIISFDGLDARLMTCEVSSADIISLAEIKTS